MNDFNFMRAEAQWLEDDSPEAQLVHECEHCGEEIYEGDEYIDYEGEVFCCRKCLMDSLKLEIVEHADESYEYAGEHFVCEEDLIEFIEDGMCTYTAELEERD